MALVGIAAGAHAQNRLLPKDLYDRALHSLKSGDYAAAQADFLDYADRYEASPARGSAMLGAAKASVYAGDFETALSVTDQYLKAYGNLPASALAYLYRGHAYLGLYQVSEALEAYDKGIAATGDAKVREAFETAVRHVAQRMMLSDVQPLLEQQLSAELTVPLWNTVAERVEAAGQRYQAAQIYGRLAARLPNSSEGSAAKTKQRNIERALANTARVGLLVPLSGDLAAYGEEMRRGVELAADQYGDSTGRQVELLTEDTKGEPVAATLACKSVLSQEPLAMIGPLTSASALGCAAATACVDVPQVIPAASERGLASVGDGVFCLTPSATVYGRTLGRFAVENLGLCSHMVIAPDDAYGHEIADAYRSAVEEAGGYIWYETYYTPGITDFGPYLRKFKSSFLDTLTDTTWFYKPDSTKMDWEEVTVYPDAVFAPGYASDLMLLLPQIRFYKIAGQLVGTDAFANDEVMMRIGANLNGSVFASVQPLVSGKMEWELFSSKYTKKYGHNPTRMSALGYDAFRFLSGGLSQSVPTPQSLGRYLHGFPEFTGAAGLVRFERQGQNGSVPIYYISDGQVSAASR